MTNTEITQPSAETLTAAFELGCQGDPTAYEQMINDGKMIDHPDVRFAFDEGIAEDIDCRRDAHLEYDRYEEMYR